MDRKLLVLAGSLALLNACGFTNAKGSGSSGVSAAPASPSGSDQSVTPAPAGGAATFTQVYQQILQPKCVACHGSGGSPDLASYSGFATDTRTIDPGHADQSVLYQQVADGSMPRGGQALTQAQLDLMASWIDAGALNN